MAIRFLDEQQPIKPKVRFLDNAPNDTPAPAPKESNFWGGVEMGTFDPVWGVGQLVPRALEQATSLGGLAPNAVSDLYKKSYQRIDKDIQKREQEYSKPEGFDWGRMAGNVLSPVNVVGGAPASFGGKLAMGAAMGATAPVQNTDNYTTEKAIQTGFGAAVPLAGAAMGRVLNPKTAPEVKQLLKEGVKLTPAEILGGSAKRGEEALSSIPLVGNVIKGAQRRSIESLNTAAINRSLSPIGKSLPRNVKSGREAIAFAETQLSNAYDDLLPKLSGAVDNDLANDIAKISQDVASMPLQEQQAFKSILDREIYNRLDGGVFTGEALKKIESSLGEKASKFGKATDAYQNELADSLIALRDSVRSMVERSNPKFAGDLNKINTGWANFKRVQRASSGIGAQEGVFSPAQLQAAVKILDKSKDSGGFARGSALMQDLSDPAKAVMQQTIPNSGSVDRALATATMLGLGTGVTVNPYAVAPLAGAALGYVPAGRRVAQALLAERPQMVRSGGDIISKYAPYLSSTSARQGTE